MSQKRREKLVELCRQYRLPIIEDDVFTVISTAFNLFLWIDSFSFSKSIPSSSIGIPNKRVPEALKRGNR